MNRVDAAAIEGAGWAGWAKPVSLLLCVLCALCARPCLTFAQSRGGDGAAGPAGGRAVSPPGPPAYSLRYSRMLEDRIRLNWAMRAFLWVITVPTSKFQEKKDQYRTPPEPGTVIVKDESEQWDIQTPNLRGADASHDMRALRQMIDAGSGQPPHWRGEGENVNLATATAMQAPVERHLLRRQKYFAWMIIFLLLAEPAIANRLKR